ncbi:MAG: flagellar hook-length control protein FliK [Pseudobdellovibrionaceae bacterium]
MLQNIVVGPPMVGATDLKSTPNKAVDKDFKGSGSDSSFGKTLDEKISSNESKEMKESPQKEMRQSKERPQNSEAKVTDKAVAKPKPEGKIGKKVVARQQAIKEFMDSFESEFEIPPTRLVEAMAKLDDAQLTQSPEATADAVVDKLDLDDADAGKARAMYAALLVQLSQMPQQQLQQPKPAPEMTVREGMSQQNMQERFLVAQNKLNAMSASVDRVNQKFWMPPADKLEVKAMPSLSGALAEKMMMDTDSLSESAVPQDEVPLEFSGAEKLEAENLPAVPPDAKPVEMKLPELPPHVQGQMKESISPALLSALIAKQSAQQNAAQAVTQNAEAMPSEEEAPALMDEFEQAVHASKVEKAQVALGDQAVVKGSNAQEFFQNQNQNQGQSLMQQNSKEFAQAKSSAGKDALSKLTEKSLSFKNALTGLEGLQAPPLKSEMLGMGAAIPAATAAVTPAAGNSNENDAAVKQIMNQAQYLIKKGGGEMKVQMTPEGLGTIHLKVMLQNGKVNMQMSADTQEAKKAIESSLAELKTSLAAHKLSMENVKVDVVNSASADTATQNQTNMNGQQQRDQTRQFWNQFNENFGSQGRRESFLDVPNLKGYGQKRDSLQPIETTSKPRTRSVEGKGSGINLVA